MLSSLIPVHVLQGNAAGRKRGKARGRRAVWTVLSVSCSSPLKIDFYKTLWCSFKALCGFQPDSRSLQSADPALPLCDA
ncbi:hypothetical protein SKAU_G00104850 [Synaphobranchus kaupii]|uniref:Uncharacterized protein n=1 Tax=Synaphobranchus kaupii TaxID=118154 RepID=A0A9Q1J6R1_SYNKA|nr:hypothetical protein SKAU_G00104850 [Synaphobranchus kaupii]